MNDTSEWAKARLNELYAALTPSRRLRMASSMFETARILATAGIRSQEPDISPAELRVRLFRRFYCADFSPERLEELSEQIRATTTLK